MTHNHQTYVLDLPNTTYAVAILTRGRDLGCPMFTVPGRNPFTAEEVVTRAAAQSGVARSDVIHAVVSHTVHG